MESVGFSDEGTYIFVAVVLLGLLIQRDLARTAEEHGRQIDDLSKTLRQLLIPPDKNPIGYIPSYD